MANLAGRLAALEQRINPKPLDVVLVLNYRNEEDRAAAEQRYHQHPESAVKCIFKLTEASV